METADYKILVVDDESDILEFVSYNLKNAGYMVFIAENGRRGIELARTHSPHLIILDVMMPEMDGIETCEKLRNTHEAANSIIVFLTARAEDYSQIAGFDAGGDDYITKPVKPKVLISRVKALLKRLGSHQTVTTESEGKLLRFQGLEIDKERHLIICDGKEITLPKKEFNLLLLLTSRPTKVFTREEIFSRIWGEEVFVGDRTIDVYIRKLREKIGEDSIKTIKGVGYKFEMA